MWPNPNHECSWIALVAIVMIAAGCSGTHSSSYRTAGGPAARYEGVVRVFVTNTPREVREIGIVQVDSVESLERAITEFQERVAQLGGDTGVIDRYSTSHEMVSSTSTESYSCGSPQAPRTCTRSVTRQHEVATLHLVGRAMTSSPVVSAGAVP